MKVLYDVCAGLDVHAKTVVACLIDKETKQIRTFSTMTDDLLAMIDWLTAAGCQEVAMESTGVYWKPIFNLIEGVLPVILVNAQHIKAVPGRKTDVKDCEWIADLLRHGLLKASFIPPLEIRELRELTRYRQTLVKEHASVANRIHRLLESGNIKLGQVASDILGVSGRLMIKQLAAGETNARKMASLARGRLKEKEPELGRALEGRLTTAQRFVLAELIARVEELDAALERVSEQIRQEVEKSINPQLGKAIELLQTIPGIRERAAEALVSEIGVDMGRFPSAGHLASWAGMCPGNNQSGGKRQNGKTTKGNVHLRRILVQVAWAAVKKKDTYLAAQYRRLVKAKGKQRALIAVGHSILVMVYHVLTEQVNYRELGGDYFDRQNVENQQRYYLRKLEALGVKIVIEELPLAA